MSTFFEALERAERDRPRRRSPTVPETSADPRPLLSAADRTGLEQLKLQFDYSKFQISLYTLMAILFAFALAFQPTVFRIHRGLLGLALVFVCLAGLAAGIVASRCAQFTSWHDLWIARIGPLGSRCLRGEYWTYLQHACFVIALVAALSSVFFGDGGLTIFVRRLVSCWSHWPPSCSPR